MEHEPNAAVIDVKAFAKADKLLSGHTPLSAFERLAEDCVGEVTGEVAWSAQGSMQPAPGGGDVPWLHVQAHAQVPMVCQRCLKPVLLPLEVAQDFRFVADEATALAEDEDALEDLLVLSRDLDLLALVEDELLMALPIVPMHEACESERAPTSSVDNPLEVAEKPNPFAVLASLRVGKE